MRKLIFAIFLFFTSFAYSQNLYEGLIAYYPFQSDANDYSGFSHHGTIMNHCEFVTGKVGNGIKLFGNLSSAGGHVLIPFINFNSLSNFTISLWVKEESMAHEHGEAYIGFGDHDTSFLGIFHSPNVNKLLFQTNYPYQGIFYADYDSSDLNKFVLYSMVFDNNVVKAYKGDSILGIFTGDVNLATTYSAIGRHWWNYGSSSTARFTGVVDEVRIYNRALTQYEIGLLNNPAPTVASMYLSSPNGGEVLSGGSNNYILWNYLNVNTIKLEYTSNNGTSWEIIDSLVPAATNQFNWTVPNINSNQCKIKITSVDNPELYDISDNSFSINTIEPTVNPLRFKIVDPTNTVTKARIKLFNRLTIYSPTVIKDEFSYINFSSSAIFLLLTQANLLYDYSGKYKIELLSDNNQLIGHTVFKYDLNNLLSNKKIDAILYVDSIMTAGNTGKEGYPEWEYYSSSDEKLVSMLIPPKNQFNQINYNYSPVLFVHGVSAFYPEWDESKLDSVSLNNYDCWQFYYPYDQNIAYSGIQLRKAIYNILKTGGPIGTGTYDTSKIGIVAHSMGGLVTRCYIQSNSYSDNIKKFLMLGTPNHGAYSAYLLVNNFFNGSLGEVFLEKDKNAPAYKDLSLSSNFIFSINSQSPKDLYQYSDNKKTYLVIAGNTDEVPFIFDEVKRQEDGVVGVSSAGLLDHHIPLGVLDLKHTKLTKNISSGIIINFLNQNYVPLSGNQWYESLLGKLKAFWSDEDSIKKFEYKTNEFNTNLGILGFRFNFDLNCLFNISRINSSEYVFFVSNSRSDTNMVSGTDDSTYFSLSTNTFPDNAGISLGENGIKSIVFGRKTNSFFGKKSYFYETNHIFNFKKIQTSLNTYVLTPDEKSFIESKSWIYGIPVVKNFKNNKYNTSKQFYIDSSLDSIIFYLSCQEGDTAFINNNFELISPSNLIIDSAYASTHTNIIYNKSFDYAYVSYFVRNPEQGTWTAEYNSNLINTEVLAPIMSNIVTNVVFEDSSYTINDSVEFEVPLPKPVNYTNVNITAQLDYQLTANDSIINLGNVSVTQKNDSTYAGKFAALNKGIYTVNLTFTCSTSKDNITRKSANSVYVTGINPPILSNPVNDTTNIPVNVNLIWRKNNSATGYHLQVFKNGDTTALIDNGNITDTTFNLTNLQNDATYFWRVKSRNSTDTSIYSEYSGFRTIIQAPVSPVLAEPPSNCAGYLNPLTFKWRFVSNASSYVFQVSDDSSFTNIIINDSNIVDTNKIISNLEIYKTYFWRVKAFNIGGGSEFSEIWNFRMLGVPNIIELIYPPNNALNQPVNITFTWNKLTNQILVKNKRTLKDNFTYNYWFELVTDTAAMSNLTIDTVLTDTIKSVSNMLNDTNYYWRVKARNDAGWGGFSQWYKFRTVIAAPDIPVLVFPSNNSIGNNINLSLLWNKSNRTENYILQLTDDSTFNNILLLDSTLTDTIKQITNLQPITYYYWRIKAKNIGGYSGFSTIWKFKTKGVPQSVVLYYPPDNGTNIDTLITFKWYNTFDITAKISSLLKAEQKDEKARLFKKFSEVGTDTKRRSGNLYWLEIVQDTLSFQGLYRDTTITDTLKQIGGFVNLTSYYWRAKAKNEIGWGGFSSWNKFTTVMSAPVAPQNYLPPNDTTSQSLSLNIVWYKCSTATNYNIQLSTDSLFGTFVMNDTTVTDTIKYISGLNPLTYYYWRIRSHNVGGWSIFGNIWKFKTIGAPYQVQLVMPENNSVNQPVDIILKWNKPIEQTFSRLKNNNRIIKNDGNNRNNILIDDSFEIIRYWLEFCSDSTFTTGVIRDTSLLDTTKLVSGLANYTKYFWRVKGKNQTGWGSFSSIWNFTTIVPLPAAPVLISPINDSSGVSLTPLLDWNDVTYAADYRVQVSVDSLFAVALWDTSSVTLSQVSVPEGKLTGLTKYYWRVNATNIAGTGLWSEVWNFRTLQNLSINLKVFLEGFWDGSSQVVDTANIYLANSTSPFAFADSATVVLSSTGTANPTFTKTVNGIYYIVVMHRNHLETWSKLPQTFFTGTPVSYDFTTAANQAYGENMKLSNGAWVLYAGDANQDGAVDALDVGIFITQFGNLGYLSCDFNGDGSVDALDVMIFIGDFGVTKAMPTLDNLPFDRRTKEQIIEEIKNRYGFLLNKENNNL